MVLLAIETSSSQASLALSDGLQVLGESNFPSRMELCRFLAPRIGELLRSRAALPTAVAVGLGPGSFTGLRIGVATAKALAHAWQIPLAGVCSLEVMAAPFVAEGQTVLALAYCSRGYLHAAAYSPDADGRPRPLAPPRAISVQELSGLVSALGTAPTVCGDLPSIPEAVEVLVSAGLAASCVQASPSAGWLARLAARLLASARPDAAFSLRPMYLFASQAERVRGIDLGLS